MEALMAPLKILQAYSTPRARLMARPAPTTLQPLFLIVSDITVSSLALELLGYGLFSRAVHADRGSKLHPEHQIDRHHQGQTNILVFSPQRLGQDRRGKAGPQVTSHPLQHVT